MNARITESAAAVQRVHNAVEELHAALDNLRSIQEKLQSERESVLRGIAAGEEALRVAVGRAAGARRARVLLAGEVSGPVRRLSDGSQVRSSLDTRD